MTDHLVVIAIDPGVTTGYAIGTIDPDKGNMAVSSEQLKMDTKQLYDRLTILEPDMIIYERFEYRNRARAGLSLFSRDLIGVIDLYCKQKEIRVFKRMAGGTINAHFDNTKLKRAGLYRPGNIHANEATMHLLHWFTFREGYKWNKEGFYAEVS